MKILCNSDHWKEEEEGTTEGPREIVVKASSLDTPKNCPHCEAPADQLAPNGTKKRKLIDLPFHRRRVIIEMRLQRYRCKACHRTSLQPLEGVKDGANITDRLRAVVEEESLVRSYKDSASLWKLSERSVRKIFEAQAQRLRKTKMPPLPRVLGLDGVYFARKERLMMTDLDKDRVLNVLATVKEDKLIGELMKLPERERKRVRVVVIDMSQSLMRVACAVFPNAEVVVDRYHIHEKANRACDRVRIELRKTRNGERRRGTPTMVRRELLRKRRGALKPHETAKLKWWGGFIPEIGEVYDLKEEFCEIWYSSCINTAKRRYEEWVEKLKGCTDLVRIAFEKMLTKTVDNWHEEIFAYFDHQYTNGFTERMNQEVKRLQRDGKRLNFESMRVKVIFGTALRWQREEEERQHRKRKKKGQFKQSAQKIRATRNRTPGRASKIRQTPLFPFTPKATHSDQDRTQKKPPRLLSDEINDGEIPQHVQHNLPLFPNETEAE